MEARIKKIFHRNKDDSSESPLAEGHDSDVPNTNTSPLRTSLYDSAAPRDPPRTGENSLKRDYSATQSPKRTLPAPGGGPIQSPSHGPHHGMKEASTISSPQSSRQRNLGGMRQTDAAKFTERSDDRNRKLPDIPASANFSGLNFDNETTMRNLNQASPDATALRSNHESENSAVKGRRGEDKSPLRESSIPQKEPGTNGARARDNSFSRAQARLPGMTDAAEKVLEKAQSSSTHTEVTETLAPAVVHETIRQDIHRIRQEVITREIHNHDYYHRILPIVDVEVLPARHFLPVEGGGLVEISADQVPGRGQHWVIAETASKIPSDQPAPRAISQFSAREFPGSEGDTKKYITPEGYERTEQTWVHPPELETGGRDTNQTWPFVLGGDAETNQGLHSKGGPSSHTKSSIHRPVGTMESRVD